MEKFIEGDEKWEKLVGSFILAFGDIELVTYILWPRYFPDKNPPNTFSDRVENLLALLKKDLAIPSEVPLLLIESLKIALKRNTVAHQPVQVQIFQHSITGELFSELAISSKIKNEYITDVELEGLSAKAKEIGRQLHLALWAPTESLIG